MRVRLAAAAATMMAIAIMFGFSLGSNFSRVPPETASIHSATIHQPVVDPPNTTIAFAQNISALGLKVGSSITMQVNVTNAPAIVGFQTIFTYDQGVLSGRGPGTGFDFSNSVFPSSDRSVLACVDGIQVSDPLSPCPPGDQDGNVHVRMLTSSGSFLPGPISGPLFRESFNVTRIGLSPFHFIVVGVFNGSITNNPTVQSFDGFFSNKQCGAVNNLPFVCQPARADFVVSPAIPHKGALVQFNATASRSPNPGATIFQYNWNWGEGDLGSNTVPYPLTNQSFNVAGQHSVTLTVTDTYGVTGSKTIEIIVVNPIIDLAIGQMTADFYQGVLPGQLVKITANVQNLGTRQENNTVLTLTLDTGLVLGSATFAKLPRNSISPNLSVVWNTSDDAPRVYRIDGYVPPAVNETNLSNNKFSIYIQLVQPRPLILLGLSLLQIAGIGVLTLVGLVSARLVLKGKLEVAVGPAMG